MADIVECRTKAEAEKAIANGNTALIVAGAFALAFSGTDAPDIVISGSADISVEAWGSSQPRVEARESSQPRVVARGSSQPRVVAWESSQPRVVAWESSQPRVVARESSQPRVVAWGSSQPRVEAQGLSQPRVVARGFVQLSVKGPVQVECSANVAVVIDGPAKVKGGVQQSFSIETPAKWCAYYGLPVKRGVVTLYKALDDNFVSPRGTSYAPGEKPEAADWDGGVAECGGGLHFSPAPALARVFYSEAKRYAGVPVRLSEIAVHWNGSYPEKVKARRAAGPCFEVDEDGEPVEADK